MFVRFRQTARRLQVSLVETRRIDRTVRHEHIAGLGAIDFPPTVADRIAFWRRLHERLGRLANRIDATAQAKILGAVHARIPMATIEEIRAVQTENAEADERFWHGLHLMQRQRAAGNRGLAASAQRTAATAEAEANKACANAEVARDRVTRLKRGEAIAGGLGKPLTQEDVESILRDAGVTRKDIENARIVAALSKLGGFDELLEETMKRHRKADRAAARTVLRRLTATGAPIK